MYMYLRSRTQISCISTVMHNIATETPVLEGNSQKSSLSRDRFSDCKICISSFVNDVYCFYFSHKIGYVRVRVCFTLLSSLPIKEASV